MAVSIVRELQADLELVIGTNTTGETIENRTRGLLVLVSAVNQPSSKFDLMVEDQVLVELNPGETYTLVADGAVYIRGQREGATATVTNFRISAT